jgi:hypothetical protein
MWSNPKKPKPKKDPKFVASLHEKKCIICDTFNEPQMSPTQAHHPIHDRFSNRKVPDQMCIPLCEGHHQGNFDNSKTAIHREPLVWRMKYGADYDYSTK